MATPTSPEEESRPLLTALGEDRGDAPLALGLFSEADLARPVRDLSIGQRRRLELARLVTGAQDLLLRDEPTNHLSPSLVEELQAAPTTYEGTLIVVTHDRRLPSAFPGPVLELTSAR
ncbi:ATP-binding cassette domain-containing protein [Streptomyces massasporeus]|uniref:ATP-binding cassette domain-containing protein n=1 Tax=Streptomyces massasporeus TaxID=67324 RepID=UPI003802957C